MTPPELNTRIKTKLDAMKMRCIKLELENGINKAQYLLLEISHIELNKSINMLNWYVIILALISIGLTCLK